MTIQTLPLAAATPPMDFGGCEFATFQARAGVTAEQIATAAARMRDGYLRHAPGFRGHRLLQGQGGQWADVVLATTQAEAERICAGFMDHAVCRDYLALMVPGSAHLGFWSRVA